ncbi:hypothetical protein QQS21_008053 [Conoideocrella luteorostrata]|uniref:Hemerythrin-like domain-containing protein n=1 Tax=Conoideocrella luteorostrata TaxID=1105319 RepID=A0AAJ0CMD4_9HYPO|nr:hypothetical protein QQS21_008053 [Conoideocrella luteorostrata]
MWSAGFTAVVMYLFLGANLFRRRSPYFHDRGGVAAPTGEWADHPVKLVATPWGKTQKDDLLTTAATHMALLHNSLIRGFNSIYLQAPHVQMVDVDDFIGYALTWHKFMVSHHDDEEGKLFPEMVEILGDAEIWGDMQAEHESFLPGLKSLETHLKTHNSTTGLSPSALLAIMDSFRDDLENHLHHEVQVMNAMSSHRNVPARESLKEAVASDMLKAWGKNTVTKAGYGDVLPFFLLNTDRTFEDGAWVKWPKMPEPVRWSMANLVGMWHGPRWKFASCDVLGRPRELYALTAEKEGREAKDKSEL